MEKYSRTDVAEKSLYKKKMTGVGFEPTHTNTSELESDPLDHSGNQSCREIAPT